MTRIACSNSPLRPSSDPRWRVRLRRAAFAAVLALGLSTGAALAQDEDQVPRTPILVIDYEELFRVSDFGQAIQQELDEKRRALSEEIAVIDAELAAEERDLTERRASLAPEEFRTLADAFDAKVQRMREQQDEKARALTRLQADEQLRFRQAALPIVGQLMLDSGALIVVKNARWWFSTTASTSPPWRRDGWMPRPGTRQKRRRTRPPKIR